MNRRGRAGQVVNFISFQANRLGDVVLNEFEVARAQEMFDVVNAAGQQIVQADHFMSSLHQSLAQTRTEEA